MKRGMEPFLVLNRTISSKSVNAKFYSDILNVLIFLHPQIPDFPIVASQPNIVITNHSSMESLFISFHVIYKSRFQKTDPCDVVQGHI